MGACMHIDDDTKKNEFITRLMKDLEVVISTIEALQKNHELSRMSTVSYNEIRHVFEMELKNIDETLIRVGV